MLNLVYFEVPAEAGTLLDFEEGGPGKILGHIMERFAPEAMYSQAGMRAIFMVADLNEAQMTELMLIVSKKFGTYPEFTALIPAAAIPEMAGKAIEDVKKAQI
ncbi:MAG: hypothetical protein ACXV5H_09340, partial [Halobacteriota archaeon]